MSLASYKKKRNFQTTPEPSNEMGSAKGKLQFVVQRHHASHLHYDFRLEFDGVLKSWAIPKGPSLDPAIKRLAVMVEDHPLSYGKFQGTIPKGNYGAGTVEIYDTGLYGPESKSEKSPESILRKGLKEGSLKFILRGEKLRGSFALVRMKDGKEKNWLLIKHRDEYAIDGFEIESSVGKSMSTSTKKKHSTLVSRSGKLKHAIKPMLAALAEEPFSDDQWVFEIKWDGYRGIAEIYQGTVELYSRNGLSFSKLYPSIVTELKKLKKDVILDGEIVILDENGKPSFQKLQHYAESHSGALVYYIFDCLQWEGKDLTELPLLERKAIAKKLIPKSDILKYSDHVTRDGEIFFRKIVKIGGLEGMIAKRADSTYEKGRRSDNWLKIKNLKTQEAIIAGYTAPKNSRKYFGALILASYEKGKLAYRGHVGTGFTEKILKELFDKFQPVKAKKSPFESEVPVNAPVTWLLPTLVCNVRYTELTQDGIMRHPVFLGLRVDKRGGEVDHFDRVSSTAKPKATTIENDRVVTIGKHEVKLTNQQKIFWPKDGFTKGDVVKYYNTIAPYILPYLKDRPQSLKRNPNGINGSSFYHKDAGDLAPQWVKTASIFSESTEKNIDYILCNNQATLVYLANLGCIEMNPWNTRVNTPDHPDYLIMDIDPSQKNTFNQVIDVALVIKEILDKAKATCYCKTSGATGIHIYIPLHAKYTYDQAQPFAEYIAALANEKLPAFTTLERSLSKRGDRIYLDFLQNRRGQTVASVYSLRPVPGASISTPIRWKEVKHGLKPTDFNILNIAQRVEKMGDIFSEVLTEKTNLLKSLKTLES